MKYIDEFSNPWSARAVLGEIAKLSRDKGALTFMEVCGTHTAAARRHSIHQILPDSVKLISGPGCPVCVTPIRDIDLFVALASRPDVIFATFGDLIRVPGSAMSLEQARTQGADVRIMYSPLDAIKIARQNPSCNVVFPAVGFETTAPTFAACIQAAKSEGIKNFFIVPANKTMPGAMRWLLDSGDIKIDGFMCPGHVSIVIGMKPYHALAEKYGMPFVVAGFEPLDILSAIKVLIESAGRSAVENTYSRVVKEEGNVKARTVMSEVFEECDSEWRGLGVIPGSGLALREEYHAFDAIHALPVELPDPKPEPAGCMCGAILRGTARPGDCRFFGEACRPDSPIGPCMVSTEGACATYYKYGT
ncbi:hydrogenase formation protein HypD [Candidatus Hydrogenedentota bacterium]